MRRQLSDYEDVEHASVPDLCPTCGNEMQDEEVDLGECRRCFIEGFFAAVEHKDDAA